jgi:hypothetical protein
MNEQKSRNRIIAHSWTTDKHEKLKEQKKTT